MTMRYLMLVALGLLVQHSVGAAPQGAVSAPGAGAGGPLLPRSEGLYPLLVPVDGEPLPEVGLLSIPPAGSGSGPRPLLVFFHSFGVSPAEVLNTDFLQEANARGWYLWSAGSRSPQGARDVNFGSVESQVFTGAGIEFVVDHFPIDRSRIYGVGFSMGAGQCMAYAARHQDPRNAMFAALVNHTGSIDQADTWREDPLGQPILNTIFGGAPIFQPFSYRRASAIELDPVTRSIVVGGDHQANNLARTPLQLWHAANDPVVYLIDQTERLHDLMLALGSSGVELNVVPGSVHSWSTLPEDEACDWLAGQQLSIASEGRLLMDRDERWLYFDVGGITPNRFASLEYDMNLPNGEVRLVGSEGLQSLTTNLRRWNGGLGQGLPLEVTLGAVDDGDTVVLRGLVQQPLGVLRDGLPQVGGWSYDPVLDELTIVEVEPGLHLWRFEP